MNALLNKILLAGITLLFSINIFGQLKYPVTKQIDQVDDYFGTKISDPYRWLENDTSSETKTWVQNQQQFTENYLSKISFRNDLRNRYKALMDYTKYYDAFKAGDYIIFSKQEGIQNQSVIYIQKGFTGEPKVFIDPNLLSADGSVSLELDGISKDKKYISYHTNKGGSDWRIMHVMEVRTQKKLPDEINWTKFDGASWHGLGFYYSVYDKPDVGTEFTAKNNSNKIYFHKLGDIQEKDSLIYEDKEYKNVYVSAQVTEDEHYLLLYKSIGTDGVELLYKDLYKPSKEFQILFKGFNHEYYVLNNIHDSLLVNTNDGADNFRIILVDTKHPEKTNWKEIVPEKPEKLEQAFTGGGQLFCSYLKDASTRIYQYNTDGTSEQEIKLPDIGSVSGINCFNNDPDIFYEFSSYTFPVSVFRYNITTRKSEVFKKSGCKINTNDYITEQVFYSSKDGTKVPMFLVHKKGIKLDASHPTLLYGYGGFNISLPPHFSTSNFVLLEQNGIYAVPNIRGGGEYGVKWHKAGYLLNKQNVFDDFIAAADYLINNKYTTKDLLAISGGSNGGLLIGAVMTQRPELFKVALPDVGVMDMLRFQKFTVGWGWMGEYGSSDSAKYFPYLLKYSPLHNIKKGVDYPATMVMTADHDDRVVPAHSYKFAATLQAKQSGTDPVLIRIDINQGHGASGSSLSNAINEGTDKWSFMFFNMGIIPKFIQ